MSPPWQFLPQPSPTRHQWVFPRGAASSRQGLATAPRALGTLSSGPNGWRVSMTTSVLQAGPAAPGSAGLCGSGRWAGPAAEDFCRRRRMANSERSGRREYLTESPAQGSAVAGARPVRGVRGGQTWPGRDLSRAAASSGIILKRVRLWFRSCQQMSLFKLMPPREGSGGLSPTPSPFTGDSRGSVVLRLLCGL